MISSLCGFLVKVVTRINTVALIILSDFQSNDIHSYRILITHTHTHAHSPFAPVDGGIASELSDSSVGGAASCDNEGSLKEGEGSKSMTLVDQVLHQDCIPVLEFEIVSIY